jgi:hypothetical protein
MVRLIVCVSFAKRGSDTPVALLSGRARQIKRQECRCPRRTPICANDYDFLKAKPLRFGYNKKKLEVEAEPVMAHA